MKLLKGLFGARIHLLLAYVTAFSIFLSSCSLMKYFSNPNSLEAIQLVSEVNANQNSATEIDVIFVYEKDALSVLPKTAPEWFSKKAALGLSLATAIDVVSLQVPPATLANIELPKRHKKAIGIYSFVNCLDVSSQAVGNLTPYKKMTIWLTPVNVIYKAQ